jgi:hypothetical protein
LKNTLRVSRFAVSSSGEGFSTSTLSRLIFTALISGGRVRVKISGVRIIAAAIAATTPMRMALRLVRNILAFMLIKSALKSFLRQYE